ncbi:anhydro-N-acetylmuramic acid kinase [Thiomicrorhabdus sp. ZW0627]|uniref:anhydro-N-acetylmuramic acid kinase n=1 Tax=Thiomicrorhabdus sp. ZW0627 TaxID=3039774 RepID=UPI002436A190|nr:anhydro-N-acetylmuramic acid kinase [Thiomicrorhabdus sp. ZW0627]MDG6774810.1 anhydro-N-acetylmuramic acid kinase [Thiomicrorhabdus sp. ZW0627]
MPTPEYFIGLMSGTSVDGVDAALVAIDGDQFQLIDFVEHPLPTDLKSQLVGLNLQNEISLQAFCDLEYQVAQQFVDATAKLLKHSEFNASKITAIGSHGQTIFHAPKTPMSLQVGHPAFIAKQTGIDTAADFRIDNLAVGGQGAPLAPAFHRRLFSVNEQACVINIGGIANISYLGTEKDLTYGFDTGPGNGLMDEICQKQFNCAYDKDGEIAASGNVDESLLSRLLQHPYLIQPFPKSTGRETFNLDWLNSQLSEHKQAIKPADLMATLCEFTAASIQTGIEQLGIQDCDIWIVGGGALNPELIRRIQSRLPGFKVSGSQNIDVNPNAVEAMMCAWLAQQRIHQTPVQLQKITGSTRDVILGGLWTAN